MTKLSDTQLVILSAACSRPDRHVLPLPTSLKGGAAKKVIDSLMAKGLIAEAEASVLQSDAIWRKTDDGKAIALVANDAACEALNIAEPSDEPGALAEAQPKAETENDTGSSTPNGGPTMATQAADAPAATTDVAPPEATHPRKTRDNSKQAQLIAMLQRPEGATIDEIVAAFGWQAHTVRGAIAGALKKKLGLDVSSEKIDGRGRVYRIEA